MKQKLNSNSSAGAAADSDMQRIVIPSAGIAANPLLGTVRQIKLRLWNPEAKVVTGGNELNTILLTTDGDFVKEFNRCQMVWLLFTGEKDDDGEEIYDGDILQARYAPNYELNVFAVKSSGASFVCYRTHNNPYVQFEQLPLCPSNSMEDLKVIGNIYQNPELLG